MKYQKKVRSFLGSYPEDRNRQRKEPIFDFLFEYYSFRFSQLLRYSPGCTTFVEGAISLGFQKYESYNDEGCWIDPSKFPSKRLGSLLWTIDFLTATEQQSPAFGCNGMHEWAMVYKTEAPRHPYLSFRLTEKEMNAFIEQRAIRCTHYDAFRFFTKEARPLNKLQPTFEDRINLEQPACIHTNMDLYKWAYTWSPWVSSDTIFECFKLAYQARVMDMKASPYDMSPFGLAPICIETVEGQKEYMDQQQRIFKEAIPLRKKLITELIHIKELVQSKS